MRRIVMAGLAGVMAWAPALGAAERAAGLLWETPLQLPASDGGVVKLPLTDGARWTVICFLGAECPLARLYGARLQTLSEKFRSDQVAFIGINSNRQDSLEELRAYAQALSITFPLVKDYDQAAADRFGAKRTPEVFVLDTTGQVRYHGRIDDQYHPGIARPQASRNDLELALVDLLAGRPVQVAETEPVGCLIGRAPAVSTPTNVTYCRDVSRVLQRHCVECHRAGDIGPFSLTDYDEVVGWGETLVEVVHQGRMPPWHASDDTGPFINARHMPAEDRRLLEEWVAGGMPFGNADELPPPAPVESDWKLARDPDLVIPMRAEPFVVPADGVVEYQYFVADPGLTEDRWVIGAEVMPGNRSVVHHAIVFIRQPDGAEMRGMGWLTAYVPGQRLTMMPPGMGRRIPAGSRLVFQMHYTPNGSEQQDLTRLGLIFGDADEIEDEIFTLMAINQNFEIPPGVPDHSVSAVLSRLPSGARLLAMAPHMHVRGKACEIVAKRGDERRPILHVPSYDFNWQHVYALQEPLPLDSIDALEVISRFDNSAANPVNPDPAEYVYWGDQTWEEMAVAFFEVARPRRLKDRPARSATGSTPDGATADGSPSQGLTGDGRSQRVQTFVDEFFQRFDADQDGFIGEYEVPISVKRFGYRRLDSDKDGRLSRDEITQHARRELRE